MSLSRLRFLNMTIERRPALLTCLHRHERWGVRVALLLSMPMSRFRLCCTGVLQPAPYIYCVCETNQLT